MTVTLANMHSIHFTALTEMGDVTFLKIETARDKKSCWLLCQAQLQKASHEYF